MARKSGQHSLTDRQARFVSEYLVDLCAKNAAIRAGYSERSAEWLGYQLLHNPRVIAAIERRREKIERKTWLNTEKILRDLEDVRVKAIESGDFRAAIRASELQGKYLGLWTERHDHHVAHSSGAGIALCSGEEARRILLGALTGGDDGPQPPS